MNGKQAKRLRRAAMGLAVTLSEAGREIQKDGYQVRRHEKPITGDNSAPAHQLLVRPDSVKGIYKNLKSRKA